MSQVSVISVDPGVTSGVVLASISPRVVNLQPMQVRDTPLGMLRRLQSYRPDFIVCEDFEFRKRAREGLILTSAHLIGVIMAYEEATTGCRLFLQSAMEGKSGYYGGDAALKKAGVYIPGQEHAMDAMRHFMQWFYFKAGYKFNKDQELVLLNAK